MHHFETWGDSWHYFPATMCFFMFIIMAVCFFLFYRKRGFGFNRNWFRQNWNRDRSANCNRSRRSESAIELLKKKYVRGEINKELFEQMKKDISDTA